MLGILSMRRTTTKQMPISYQSHWCIGPSARSLSAADAHAGVPAEFMPYIKSTEVFHCPDDNGGMVANG